MPPPVRRVWCSCVIIDYLAGKTHAAACEEVINHAKSGQIEIVVSALAEAEVVKLDGHLQENAEAMIAEFFERDYVIRADLGPLVAKRARTIVRDYHLKPLDAVHVATAIEQRIEILETYDGDMITAVDGQKFDVEGVELMLGARNPIWEKVERPLDRLLRESQHGE